MRAQKKRNKRKDGKSHYGRPSRGTEEIKQAQLAAYLVNRYATTSSPARRRPPRVVSSHRSPLASGKVYCGDALAFLRSVEDDSAALVFLDPPFNLGKAYSTHNPDSDTLPDAEYGAWMTDILAESARVLRRGGTLYLYHLPLWAMRFGATIERFLDFRQWIAISMKNAFVANGRLYPAHYALLCFAKGKPSSFARPRIKPRTCRHCGRLVKDYGGYLPIIARQGVNLSDFWDDLSPVRHAGRKNRRGNELPPLLFARVMEMSAVDGGLYVDPFVGAGSGIVAAVEHGMRFVGCDLVPDNCTLIKDRVRRLVATRRRERD